MTTTARKSLNTKQLHILYALYKFRYGTEELLAQHQGNVSRRYMHERVRILCEQEYIGRRYDGNYRIAGKPAYYYLLPKGIAVLKQRPDDFNYQVLRNIRKDVTGSDKFVEHSLNVFAVYIEMKKSYGDSFKFFTASYLHQYDYFPKPLPDGYVSIQQPGEGASKHFIVECFDDTKPGFVIKKRIEQLLEHADSGEWPSACYPELLFVCCTEALKKKVEKWSAKVLEASWVDDLMINVMLKGELL
jgi:hypothetical protein